LLVAVLATIVSIENESLGAMAPRLLDLKAYRPLVLSSLYELVNIATRNKTNTVITIQNVIAFTPP